MTQLPPEIRKAITEIELEIEDLEKQTSKRIALLKTRLGLLLGPAPKERKVTAFASHTGRKSKCTELSKRK